MPRPCKVCTSELLSEIDDQILVGITFNEIETFCISKGLRVSGKSIGEHARNHVEGYVWRSDTIQNQSENRDDDGDISPICAVEIPKVRNSKQFAEVIKKSLSNSIVTAAVVVEERMRVYASGKSKLPRDEIASLEKLVGIYDKITGKHFSDRSGKHIFDLDGALRLPDS